jgi:hypothetical protein
MTLEQLITSALRLDGTLGAGETASTDELSDALMVAQLIIDGWNGEPAAQPKHTLLTVVLGGSPSYVLAVKPLLVTGAHAANAGGVAQPVKVVTDAAEFGALAMERSITANWPRAVFVDYGSSSCTVHVAPLSTGTLYLSAIVPEFATFAAVSDNVTLPGGYLNLFRLELAVRLAAEYGRPVPADVMQAYTEAKASIGGRNNATRAGAPPAPAA